MSLMVAALNRSALLLILLGWSMYQQIQIPLFLLKFFFSFLFVTLGLC